jgi:hypothetical protein
LVLEDGGDETQAIATRLHDAVEGGGSVPMLEVTDEGTVLRVVLADKVHNARSIVRDYRSEGRRCGCVSQQDPR